MGGWLASARRDALPIWRSAAVAGSEERLPNFAARPAMLFNSHSFILFVCLVLALHYAPLTWRVKKFNLLVASYLFYSAWNPPFVLLLVISTLVDWFVGRGIYYAVALWKKRLLVGVSLAVNLGLLGFFKYGTFLLDNFRALLAAAGVDYVPPDVDIILPVGISFYTFQTLSYTLDIYLYRQRPWHSFLDYAMYVTFFPQLVAGPIVRAYAFLPQCGEPRRATAARFAWGAALFVVGLFEKVVIADGLLAPIADQGYDGQMPLTMLAAWCGTLAFAGQIFCDFAGYSTCAIGVAMCLGFALPDNFRYPYAAIGFSDFWRRWHISLSTWLRDYLYIPLGGNRRGTIRTYVNLMVTMLLGGLWHGASWTFVFWGGLHGLYLVVERWLRRHIFLPAPEVERDRGNFAAALATFVLACFTWVFFRAETFAQAFSLSSAMLGWTAAGAGSPFGRLEVLETFTTLGLMLIIHYRLRNSSLESAAERLPWWLRAAALAGMLLAIVTMPGEDRAFIYFQF